ncbi:vacuolar sorting protein [Vararia minispora EC-137]|uniref:Vacuolar sorting protein n=1 Tax=Vararia minispora EC-137 TaxID=1314806 RepID=A0ACB8QGC1_9AGAM|nr:vacuolar sorting protein [Vararia minispora EC-137]
MVRSPHLAQHPVRKADAAVQTTVNLLDSLESFLSTFQNDLSAVSGQISDLQSQSKDIEGRLKSRKKIEKPLSNLISNLILPPPLATTILDTDVGESWIPAIEDFERRLEALKSRARVRAARDLSEVTEGVRIVAATKLRSFFLALIAPVRRSMTTNMHVVQSAVFSKYRPLYAFLSRQAPAVAQEVQRAYVAAARVYYETGFRRYMRSLGYVKARSAEKEHSIVADLDSGTREPSIDQTRLGYARIEGPGVTLMLLADDKSHTEVVEALLRSALLVLMDNGTAEYAFVTTFFAPEPNPPAPATLSFGMTPTSSVFSTEQLGFDLQKDADDGASTPGSDYMKTPRAPTRTPASTVSVTGSTKEEQKALDAVWKQIMDPALEHTQNFVKAALEPLPPVIPLLTMIRLTEEVMSEVQKRDSPPLESFIFGIRLQMWPLFQRVMTEQVDALKKLAEGATGGYFRRGAVTTDASVSLICKRYVVLFMSFVMLTEQNEETMIFSNLLRLRQELTKLIESHTEKLGDAATKARAQSALYEELLQGLNKAFRPAPSHPRAEVELAYWRKKEEAARTRRR